MDNTPHGGHLLEHTVEQKEAQDELREQCAELPFVTLDATALADLELLGNGGYSPLGGFMARDDFEAVLSSMRLASGLPWPIPIVVGASEAQAASLTEGQRIALRDSDGVIRGAMTLSEKYPHDARSHALAVYGTDSPDHPGVGRVLGLGEVLLAGAVEALPPSELTFQQYRLTPRQVRAEFQRRGWRTVVAFQTRNPIHRAHEYLMKCALESTDGLLLHPIVGHTKSDDIQADVRVRSYEVLLREYFAPGHSMMAVFPAAMRYAGPREALYHAIVRKNYGCTHFIVGRDHAGATDPEGKPYYGSYEAHEVFAGFTAEELGIKLFFYEHAFYCRQCEAIVTAKTAPPAPGQRFALSGTAVRDILRTGQRPPPEITRPEVADVLIEAMGDRESQRTASTGRWP